MSGRDEDDEEDEAAARHKLRPLRRPRASLPRQWSDPREEPLEEFELVLIDETLDDIVALATWVVFFASATGGGGVR